MRFSALVVFSAIVAPAAAAQSIAGRVTDRASNEAIAGVVVSGLDSSRAVVVARSITDRANGYRLTLLPGIVRLQFRRIGYAPVEVALSDSVNGRIDVAMTRLPTQLPPVKAITTAQCDPRPDREEAMALWEQARSGMLTSIVAREAKSAWISVLAYQFYYLGDAEQPRTVQRIELASASNAFAAGGDPATLMKDGYVGRSRFGAQEFLGPDDVVLFDETFIATHCFSLLPAAGDDSTIALRFEPGKGRRKPDIDGIVFLRKDPMDLKAVVFRYVNIDRSIERVSPGGSIAFRVMPNGITMIHEWRIRGAGYHTDTQRTPRGDRRRTTLEANETGAVIELIQWPDGEPYLAGLGRVTGVAREEGSGKALRNRDVRFDRTPFTAKTDSTGRFQMIDVLPGLYQLDIGESVLDRFGVAPPQGKPRRVVAGANDLGDVTVESPAALVKRACDDKEYESTVRVPIGLGSSAVFGRIMGAIGPTPNRDFQVEVRPASLVAGSAPFKLKGRTDGSGNFRICGVPIDGTVTVRAEAGSLAGREELLFDQVTALETPYQLVTVTLKPRQKP